MKKEVKLHENYKVSCSTLKYLINENTKKIATLLTNIKENISKIKEGNESIELYKNLLSGIEQWKIEIEKRKILVLDYITKSRPVLSEIEFTDIREVIKHLVSDENDEIINHLLEIYKKELLSNLLESATTGSNEGEIMPEKEVDQRNTDNTRFVFVLSLRSLILELKNNEDILKQFPHSVRDDILEFKVTDSVPWRGGIYDIHLSKREIAFSQELLKSFQTYWDIKGLSMEEKEVMCWLYYFHEFRHIEQKVDSNTYLHSKNSKTIFQKLDYIADSFAVKNSFLLKNKDEGAWNKTLAKIIEIHIKGGEVFSTLDNGEQPQSIDGERLHRQMIWHFQYARALLYKPESSLNEFDIDKNIALEIFEIKDESQRKNFCSEENIPIEELRTFLSIHILWGEERFIYHITLMPLVNFLLKGIFEGELEGSVEAFRPFFADNPQFTGRNKNLSININPPPPKGKESFESRSNAEDENVIKSLRNLLPKLYKQGPKDRAIWERSGGDVSTIPLDGDGKTQWHTALTLLSNGGGGDISIDSLVETVKEDFPKNSEIIEIIKAL